MEQTIGKYKILREIGRGGMGIVYKALDLTSQRPVAVKVLPPSMVDRSMVERFNREVAAMVRLKHPNIVEAYEFGMAQGQHFFAMEYVEGESLRTIIKNKGPMEIDTMFNVTIQVARGLGYAHQEEGMAHRDIKPDNILIKEDGLVKVMDFGLVQIPNVTRVTIQGSTVGTAEYMSPEQVSGEEIDTRTDIYSLGVMMFEMLIGHPPFRGDNVQAVMLKHRNEPPPSLKSSRSDISAELERIVFKAMAKDVATRYQKAEELIEDIKKLKGDAFINNIEECTSRVHQPAIESKSEILAVARPRKKSKTPIFVIMITLLTTLGLVFKDRILTMIEEMRRSDKNEGGTRIVEDAPVYDQQDALVREAEDHFKILAQADDHNSLGLKYVQEGRWEEAIGEFRQAIELRPDYPGYYKELALAYEASEKDNLALEAWQDLLKYEEIGALADQAREHVIKIRGW